MDRNWDCHFVVIPGHVTDCNQPIVSKFQWPDAVCFERPETVHDLGNDVPVRRFVEKAEETSADIIAASAILTTTMTYMPDVIATLSELGLRDKYKIMVGGAPVISDWAIEIGADGYGEDAVEAVEVAKNLMQAKRGGKVK